MPYGVGFRANVGRVAQREPSAGANYIQQQGTIRRHEWQSGDPVTLTGGLYKVVELATFKRTFDTGVADTPPTANASNNYPDFHVMNGSRIENFSAKLYFQMSDAAITTVAKYLDIYVMALSFWDALVLDSILPANSPVSMNVSGTTAGEVNFKTPALAFLTPNTIKNFKFLQHYIKHLGTVELSHALSDDSQVVVDVPDIPAKCRRSQTGMFYALFILNDSLKNQGASVSFNLTADRSFMEIPSENRLPFIE